MTTTLLLVRHAAHGLLGRVLTGRMPGVSLGEEGRRQAARLAERLSRETVAAVYSSPLERARETAEPIAARFGLLVQVEERLDEIDVGDWQGRDFAALAQDPGWNAWNTASSVTRAPGGETMLEAQARAIRVIEQLRAAHPDTGVVLVSHGDVIKAALLYHLGLPIDAYQRIEVGPASLSVLVVGDWGARVLSLNETVAA